MTPWKLPNPWKYGLKPKRKRWGAVRELEPAAGWQPLPCERGTGPRRAACFGDRQTCFPPVPLHLHQLFLRACFPMLPAPRQQSSQQSSTGR